MTKVKISSIVFLCTFFFDFLNPPKYLREAPPKKKHVYIWALPKLRFDPPYCANPCTLWHNFFAENEKILKTAILTMGMNILTVTKVKDDSEMAFYGNQGKY